MMIGVKRLCVGLVASAMATAAAVAQEAVSSPFKSVEVDLPEETQPLPPEQLDALENGDVVRLMLRLPAGANPSVRLEDLSTRVLDDGCGFGVVEGVRQISVSGGSNHLLLDIRPGAPEHHAANLVACEYAGGPPAVRVTVRGCYLVNDVSIPTARQLVLNPLPASACGLYAD